MREILFKAKRVDNNEWIEGSLAADLICPDYPEATDNATGTYYGQIPYVGFVQIIPPTACQFTGAYEFVNCNPNIKGRIFEGDIVQVWSRRRPAGGSYFIQKSVHDEPCLVRAVVIFNKGEWQLDYNNKYNASIAAARGNERYNRIVANSPVLFDWGHNRNRENLKRYPQLNPNRSTHDIQVIGNIFDNPELLEEETHHV
jgi:hypothetical protein